MLMKLIGFRDIEFKAFYNVYLILAPGTQLNAVVPILN
jgi:hypothetical protein